MKRAKRKRRELPKYLTAEEIDALFRVIQSRRDRALFQVAYFYGLRASEVGLIDISDWHWSRVGVSKLAVRRLKGSEDGCFAMPDDFERSLRAWVKERGDEPGPLFPSSLGTAISRQMLDVLMRKYCALAGIDKRRSHFHALKHSICTNLLEAGESITDVQQQVGHRNINNTMVYARITGKAVAAREKRLRSFGSRRAR